MRLSTRDSESSFLAVPVKLMLSPQCFADLSILAECDYFIGTFSDDFSRLAYLVLVSGKGYTVPHISLDEPYFEKDME